MTARRAKIQIKPKIVPGISKRDSNRNGANNSSKEIPGEHSNLQESSSGPSGTDKQNNAKPNQQQSAFSLRPKTGLRGSVVPRLHGSMDSMKHIPTAAPGNVPSDQNSEGAVPIANDQCTDGATPSTVVADQCISAAPVNQVTDLCTPAMTPVKDAPKQPDKIIKESCNTNILVAENAENSSQVSSSVKEVGKSPQTMGTTSKPAVKPVISRRSRFSVQPKIRTKVPNQPSGSSSLGKPAIPSVSENQYLPSLVQKASPAKNNEETLSRPKSVSENNTTELVGEDIMQKVQVDLSKPNTDAVEKIEKDVSNSKTLLSKPATGLTADGESLLSNSKTAIDVASDSKALPASGKTVTTAASDGKNLPSSSKEAVNVTLDGMNLPSSGKTATDVKILHSSGKPVTDAASGGKALPNCGKIVTEVTSDDKILPSSGKPATDVTSNDNILPISGKPATDVTSNDKILPISGKPATDVTSNDKILPSSGKPATDVTSNDKILPSSGKPATDMTSNDKILPNSGKPATDVTSNDKILPSSGKPATDMTSNDKILPNSGRPATNVPQKVISRRSRFALQPKVGARPGNRPNCTSGPQVKPTVRFQEPRRQQQLPEHLQTLSEEKTVGISTVVVFKDGKECELIDPTPLSTDSQASASPKSATTETSSSNSQVESLSPSLESGYATDSTSLSEQNKHLPQLKSSDETVAATTKSQEPETKSPVSRRSKFQVRPKLGMTKRPENTTEECVSQESPKSTKNLKPAISKFASTKVIKNLVSANCFTKLVNSEQDGSSTDQTPSRDPRLMKDEGHVDNTKLKDYPVTLPKSVTKTRKTLPLREKQKKPDLSEHPADQPPDRSKMRMRDLIYWNPISSPMKSPEKKTTRTIRLGEETSSKVPENQSNENEPFAVPQVKIGADGNIVINEESLVISNTQPSAPISSDTVDETDIYSNYGSFRKYTPKSKWSLKETKKFFLALSTVGTDFSMMSNLFPNKTRRDLKNKFKREERKNRWLIDKAIKQQLHFDEHLFEDKSESEDEVNEDEVSAKKMKQEKATKTKKNNKTAAANTPKRKQKKVCKKDFVIESEAGSLPTQEVVMEEAVQDDILIMSENEPYSEDNTTINQNKSSTHNETGKMPNNLVQRSQPENVSINSQTNEEEEVVGILMELGRSGSMSTTEENITTAVVDSNKTCLSTASAVTEAIGGKEILAVTQNATPSLLGNSAGVVKDSSSLARTFLQQMGLNKHINTLQDEIVSITEAEISNDDCTQKVILVEVRPKNQKQTVVHMYLVSPTEPRTDTNQTSTAAENTVTVNSGVPHMSAHTLVTSTLPAPSAATLVTTTLPPPPASTLVTATLHPPPTAPTLVTATLRPPPTAPTLVTATLRPPSTAPTLVTATLRPSPTAPTLVTATLRPLSTAPTLVNATLRPLPPAPTLVNATLRPLPPAPTLVTTMLPPTPVSTLVTATLPPSAPRLVTSTLPPSTAPTLVTATLRSLSPAPTQVTTMLPPTPVSTLVTATLSPPGPTLVTAALHPPPTSTLVTTTLPPCSASTLVTSTLPPPPTPTLVTTTLPPPSAPTQVTVMLPPLAAAPTLVTPVLPTQTVAAAATTVTTSSTTITTNITTETLSETVFAPSR